MALQASAKKAMSMTSFFTMQPNSCVNVSDCEEPVASFEARKHVLLYKNKPGAEYPGCGWT